VLLDEGDEGAADTGAALIWGRDQHPELARVSRDVVDPDAAGNLAVPGRDRDLSRAVSSAISAAVVRGAPSCQSPLSAVVYTSLMRLVR
jgi:hypothetical protein